MKEKTYLVILYLTILTGIRIFFGHENSMFAGMLMIVAMLIVQPEW